MFLNNARITSLKVVYHENTLQVLPIQAEIQGEIIYIHKSSQSNITFENIRKIVNITKCVSNDILYNIYYQIKQVFMPSISKESDNNQQILQMMQEVRDKLFAS